MLIGCANRRIRRPGEEGSTIVEMALALLFVILPLLFGSIEISMALYSYHFTADASREATRWAIVRGSQCSTNTPALDHCGALQADIQTYVRALGYPGSNNLNVTAAWKSASTSTNASNQTTTTWSACGGTCNSPGNMVLVTVTYPFPLGIFRWKVTTLNVSSTSAMIITQ